MCDKPCSRIIVVLEINFMYSFSCNGAIREKIKLFLQLIEQTSNTRFNQNQRGSLVDDTCGPNPSHYAFILCISYLEGIAAQPEKERVGPTVRLSSLSHV
jgi:hypothetical protein